MSAASDRPGERPRGSTGPRGSEARRTSGAGRMRAFGRPTASLAALNVPWVHRFHWPSVRVPSGDSPGNTMPSGSGRPCASRHSARSWASGESSRTVRSAPVLVPFNRPIELAPVTRTDAVPGQRQRLAGSQAGVGEHGHERRAAQPAVGEEVPPELLDLGRSDGTDHDPPPPPPTSSAACCSPWRLSLGPTATPPIARAAAEWPADSRSRDLR